MIAQNAITTVIFDLDGLLADTEKLHRRAYQDVLAGMGIAVSDRQYHDHWTRDGKGIAEYVAEHHLAVDPDLVRQKKAVHYKELVLSGAEPMPGALSTLDALYGHKTLALATASGRDAAHAVLDTLGITHYFACITTQSAVRRRKPCPDIFLRVAAVLGVDPGECLIVEDAQKGILAAAAAGMHSVAIPNAQTHDNDFSRATMVLTSLDQLTLEKIEEIGNEL